MKAFLLITAFCCYVCFQLPAQTLSDTTTSGVSDTVRTMATFPGGQEGWIRYLQHHLRAEVGAANLRVKKHQTIRQTAVITFLVDKQGKISEVAVVNPTEVHPKLAEEAMRVIKKGPDWIPATVNGELVIYRQQQAITFEVSGR